jgi:hypothetical protein
LRPSPSAHRLQRTTLAGQLSLFDHVESVDGTDLEQAPAVPAPSQNAAVAMLVTSSPSATHTIQKKQTRKRQSGRPKPPATAAVPLDTRLLVSRKAAAEMLTISIRKVDYMIADGRMPTRRIDNRVLIPIEEIHKFARTDHRRRKAG